MFLRNETGLELAGGTAARPFGRASLPPAPPPTRWQALRTEAERIDWVPDLGCDIGSRQWWRGLAVCVALCAGTWMLRPDFGPLIGAAPAPLAGPQWEEARA